MVTSAQVVKTSVSVTSNNPDITHLTLRFIRTFKYWDYEEGLSAQTFQSGTRLLYRNRIIRFFFLYRMKDCGEDMLVDMSEILFNELAFFRLMQDLDG